MTITLGVSSYSFQDEYQLGLMSLEDTMACVSAIGGTGYEAILEEMLPAGNFMHLSDQFVQQWFELLDKYHLEPTCADIFDDFNLFRNRTLTHREQLDQMIHYMDVAKKLGFKVLRVLCNTPIPVLEAALPIAEGYNMKLGLEIHAPLSMRSDWAENWKEVIAKTGSKFGGFVPDFGIFGLRPLTLSVNNAIKKGADPNICQFIIDEYQNNARKRSESGEVLKNAGPEEMLKTGTVGAQALAEEVKKMGGGELELSLVNMRLSYDNPEWLVDVIDLIVHVHAKFYDMVSDGEGGYKDPNIDTETVVRVLRDNGYNGFLSSEYEGHHFFRDPGEDRYPDGPEQVRRHHIMMRKILTEPYIGKLSNYGR
ncbi:MAG: TIM barrel protein [Anaerolineaceae bacterium]|nr:TIM barrel protein [Anaerolineaceae bacterium]